MPKPQELVVRLNIQLKGQNSERFRRIKQFLGLENDTEVIRTLISWYYAEHEKDLSGPPRSMFHVNLNSEGVLVWDPDINLAVQILFKPDGVYCMHDESSTCRHVQFALSKPDIQNVIRQKRKEGWKLPDV